MMVMATMMATSRTNVHDFSFTSIEGNQINLADFKGKKILIVNTASKCGFTKQYAGLQELSEKYADKLVVIGFPSGNFREQELGSNALIQEFCEQNYGVTFLLSEKSEVKGKEITPLFDYLIHAENGELIHRFRSKVDPMDRDLTGKL